MLSACFDYAFTGSTSTAFPGSAASVDLERELALNVVTVAVDELVVDGGNAQPLDLAALVSHAVMR